MHKGLRHTGKVPARLAGIRVRSEQLRTLRRSLDEAIHDERYEDAAQIRDELAALEAPSPRA